MKTKEEIIKQEFEKDEIPIMSHRAFFTTKKVMEIWADQEKQALKEKIKNHIKECYTQPSADNIIKHVFEDFDD